LKENPENSDEEEEDAYKSVFQTYEADADALF